MKSFGPTIFRIEQLAFERNYQLLFQKVNCELHSGELLQIRGDNGSGKSTLLRIIAGFIEPHAGTILWQNESILKQRDIYQQQLHYVGHQNGIKKHLTVYENLLLNCALSIKKPEPAHLKTILQKVQLHHLINKQTTHLSAGQLRRLALLRLLLNPVPLWILDEPTTALDETSQHILMDIIQEHLKNQGLAIVATHQSLPFTSLKTIHLGKQHDDQSY